MKETHLPEGLSGSNIPVSKFSLSVPSADVNEPQKQLVHRMAIEYLAFLRPEHSSCRNSLDSQNSLVWCALL